MDQVKWRLLLRNVMCFNCREEIQGGAVPGGGKTRVQDEAPSVVNAAGSFCFLLSLSPSHLGAKLASFFFLLLALKCSEMKVKRREGKRTLQYLASDAHFIFFLFPLV